MSKNNAKQTNRGGGEADILAAVTFNNLMDMSEEVYGRPCLVGAIVFDAAYFTLSEDASLEDKNLEIKIFMSAMAYKAQGHDVSFVASDENERQQAEARLDELVETLNLVRPIKNEVSTYTDLLNYDDVLRTGYEVSEDIQAFNKASTDIDLAAWADKADSLSEPQQAALERLQNMEASGNYFRLMFACLISDRVMSSEEMERQVKQGADPEQIAYDTIFPHFPAIQIVPSSSQYILRLPGALLEGGQSRRRALEQAP